MAQQVPQLVAFEFSEVEVTAGGTDFDLAFSFSGDNRAYVAEVAAGLRRRGFRVFYDQYLRAELIGQELLAYLQDVYSRRSATVAAFVSEQWVSRPWPAHERETALAHALLSTPRGVPFLLPFRFDDAPVPGLQPTVGYEDLRTLHPGERRWRRDPRFKHPVHVAELLVEVLRRRGIEPSSAPEDDEDAVGFAARLVWIEGAGGLSARRTLPMEELEEGATEVFADEVEEGGPVAGRYLLLREELGAVVRPNEPIPVFLHEAYRAHEKSWVQPFGDPEEEPAVAEHVKRQVQVMVEHEIALGSVPIGPTFTRAIASPLGLAVHGICVLARRAP